MWKRSRKQEASLRESRILRLSSDCLNASATVRLDNYRFRSLSPRIVFICRAIIIVKSWIRESRDKPSGHRLIETNANHRRAGEKTRLVRRFFKLFSIEVAPFRARKRLVSRAGVRVVPLPRLTIENLETRCTVTSKTRE